ncbi:type II toxin-antitoxin system RelE family toxin [Streptomyces sp. NPDC057638]|uniref:type II toxin-antitoxin system RelE family toxin n=1 Tax=Streptomyces sp. NPDC057638 TaxID=3346190 RepID=UPI0036B16F22
MAYRVQYSSAAADSVKKMSEKRRKSFLGEVGRLAENPYVFGVALQGNEDRREATLAGAAVVFWVSRNVLTMSVITVVHAD